MLDPWGFPNKPKKLTSLVGSRNPVAIFATISVTKLINVFATLRLLGPLGKS